MSRPLRIEYADLFYYVSANGNEGKQIFKSAEDRHLFFDCLASAADRYGAVIHAYCLMRNHYHILLQTRWANISQVMRHINGTYTARYNRRYKRSGHLLQGRYRALIVDMNTYARDLSQHMHLNPVRSGFVDRPEDYPWTSYRCYIGLENGPAWLSKGLILSLFAPHKQTAQQEYRLFVESLTGRDSPNPLKQAVGATFLGDAQFIADIRQRLLPNKPEDLQIPALRGLRDQPEIEQLVNAAYAVLGEHPKTARNVALYLCHRYTGRKLREIGRYFNISESGISQASRRMTQRIENDSGLKEAVEKIRMKLHLIRTPRQSTTESL